MILIDVFVGDGSCEMPLSVLMPSNSASFYTVRLSGGRDTQGPIWRTYGMHWRDIETPRFVPVQDLLNLSDPSEIPDSFDSAPLSRI